MEAWKGRTHTASAWEPWRRTTYTLSPRDTCTRTHTHIHIHTQVRLRPTDPCKIRNMWTAVAFSTIDRCRVNSCTVSLSNSEKCLIYVCTVECKDGKTLTSWGRLTSWTSKQPFFFVKEVECHLGGKLVERSFCFCRWFNLKMWILTEFKLVHVGFCEFISPPLQSLFHPIKFIFFWF